MRKRPTHLTEIGIKYMASRFIAETLGIYLIYIYTRYYANDDNDNPCKNQNNNKIK